VNIACAALHIRDPRRDEANLPFTMSWVRQPRPLRGLKCWFEPSVVEANLSGRERSAGE
jgi:hypothetical protein